MTHDLSIWVMLIGAVMVAVGLATATFTRDEFPLIGLIAVLVMAMGGVALFAGLFFGIAQALAPASPSAIRSSSPCVRLLVAQAVHGPDGRVISNGDLSQFRTTCNTRETRSLQLARQAAAAQAPQP